MGDYAERKKRGKQVMDKLGWSYGSTNPQSKACPAFWEMTVGHLMGDVWARPGLSLRDRELVTLGAIIAMSRPMGIKTHLRDFAPNVGITREELQEIIIQAGHYAGWPAANNAIYQLNEIIEEQKSKKTKK